MLCRRLFQIKNIIYQSVYTLGMESMAKNKQFDVQEDQQDKNSQFNIQREKTIFSKDERSQQYQLLDIKAPDVNPQKEVFYAYDKEKFTTKPRFVYQAPIKKRMKKQLQQTQFQQFKESMIDKTEKLQSGEGFEKKILEDELWNNEPPIRYYGKVLGKELFFAYRNPSFKEVIDRKNIYLPLFQRPFNYHNNDIKTVVEFIRHKSLEEYKKTVYDPNYCLEEDYYAKNPELRDHFELLKKLISSVSYKELPTISLAIAFDLNYKVDVFQLWKLILEQVSRHIHHFTPIQILQLRHAFAGSFPKVGNYQIHQNFLNLILEDLNNLKSSEILHAMHAFRLLGKVNYAVQFAQKLLEKLPEAKGDEVANSFYSIASNFPKAHQKKKTKDVTEDYKQRLKYMDAFEDKLKEAATEMSIDGVTRSLLGVRLMRLSNYDDLVLHFEKRIKELEDKIEPFHCHQILYALSKAGNGQSLGQVDTYQTLFKYVNKYWDQFENLEKSRIFYAYSSHSLVSKEDLNSLFLPWVRDNMPKFSYSELQNVAYGLMFTNTNEKQIWIDFIRNVATQQEVCPLVNYFALKQAKYFIKQYYPEWNLKPFEDTCYEAENQFQAFRVHRQYDQYENVVFQQYIGTNLSEFDIKTMYIFENLYYLQIVLIEPRIALINQSESLTLPQGGPRPQLLLKKQILESLDWKPILVDQREFQNLPKEQKVIFLKKLINDALNEQKPKIKKWELKRRQYLEERLENMALRSLTPGKKGLTEEDEKYFERKVT